MRQIIGVLTRTVNIPNLVIADGPLRFNVDELDAEMRDGQANGSLEVVQKLL